MHPHFRMLDAQTALGFLVNQTAFIEKEVYQTRFVAIQYQDLIPVDYSAPEWATSIEFYSEESFGAAKWLANVADDFPYGSDEQTKFVTAVGTAGRGYRYSLAELSQAAALGIPLDTQRAVGALRAYEEFVDLLAFTGDSKKNLTGLINNASVPQSAAPNGAGGSPLWTQKTSAEVLADFNSIITGIQTATNTVALGDTVLLPYQRFNYIASTQLPSTDKTLLQFLQQSNVFTANTGQPLTIRSVRGLEAAGAGSTMRMMAYRRHPEVLKMHIPMPLKFLRPQEVGAEFRVPGIFRVGGLDIRLPKEVRYLDGI